jgi:hypothetical protein
MIDLAHVWEWLEHVDEDDFDELHSQTAAELKAAEIEESEADCAERDAAATAIVLGLTRRGGDLDRAMASELGLEFEEEGFSKKPTVFELLRTSAKPVAVVSSYDLKRGYYVVHVTFANLAHALQIERSWNDLRRLCVVASTLATKESCARRLPPPPPFLGGAAWWSSCLHRASWRSCRKRGPLASRRTSSERFKPAPARRGNHKRLG